MRKYQQKQILDVIGTLKEAAEEMKRLFSCKDIPAVVQLLADCQAGAVEIGTFIEEIEGEGTRTVAYLEEYCDLLYAISSEIEGAEAGFVKKLKKQLIKIENSVRGELKPNKIEVLFLPYKASMWDALESIWLAAKDDPRCEAYVVPIPYFDRTPEGAMGRMHYEGGEYPSYVPVTDWREYRIEDRRPDAIFIHNPYDEANRVTSVHPDYYSRRLKEYTDMLCYSPYFVAAEDVEPHFCALPGVLYADRVFVQSEKIKNTYIRVFKEFEKKNRCAGRFGRAEEKFIAAGSPKFDKVVNAKEADFTLPAEWRALIEKPGGARKKIVLYNTSLGALLQGNTQYLEKLKYVLGVFRGRDDVVLWWRPHPLNEATYETMRPQLLAAYRGIVAEYRSEGYGIYDDTADLHRALCLSSMYYGDWSSLTMMYGLTGKPIVMQAIPAEGTDSEQFHALLFNNFVVDAKGECYAWELLHNSLFRLDFDANEAAAVAQDAALPGVVAHPYIALAALEGQIIAAPFWTDAIFACDTASGEGGRHRLDGKYKRAEKGYQFCCATPYRGRLYCIGAETEVLAAYDPAQRTVEYDTALFEYLQQKKGKAYAPAPIYISDVTEDGDVFVLFIGHEELLQVNLHTKAVVPLASEPVIGDCAHAIFDGEAYWLFTAKNDALIRWDARGGELRRYTSFPAGYQAGSGPDAMMRMVDCGQYLLLFPSYGNMILRFDKQAERMSEYGQMPVPHDPDCALYKYDMPLRIAGRVYAFARFNRTVYALDPDCGEVSAHQFHAVACADEAPEGSDFYFPRGFEGEGIYQYVISEALLLGGLPNVLPCIPASVYGQKSVFERCIANASGTAGICILQSVIAKQTNT